MTLLDFLDFHIGFSTEKIPGHGEDAWCYSFNERAGLLAAFDGCGGLGAATYARLSDHSGAYLASRAAAGAFMDWFQDCCSGKATEIEDLKKRLMDYYGVCVNQAQAVQSKLRGAMVRLMPTTAAAWFVLPRGQQLLAMSVWAGDSRTYLLDGSGLAQVSVDDLDDRDAMSNLYDDGAMTNVLSADGNFRLHHRNLSLAGPCVLLSCTDGCFGYLRSPMEFEFMLLDTLFRSAGPEQWQQLIQETVGAVAGDDQTMSLAAFGYRSFAGLKSALLPRLRQLQPMIASFGEGLEERKLAWQTYRTGYYRLAEGGGDR